ncbi:MAG: hypothetical protein FWF22_01345 [Treponema sp.]|nr:hypothetical protein [Treponema sp.]
MKRLTFIYTIILLALGIVFAGCSNPSLSTDTEDQPFTVLGLPSVNVHNTGTAGLLPVVFSGNRELSGDTETIVKTPVRDYVPVYEWTPVYEQIPVYAQVPVYEEIPVYRQVPVYEQIPVYEQVPIYDQVPVYEQIPIYQRIPIYNYIPVYDQIPVYNQIPQFNQIPVYKQIPVYGDVQKEIDTETWISQKASNGPAWAGWATDDETFPRKASGFIKDGVIRVDGNPDAMAVVYNGQAREVLLIQNGTLVVGSVTFEPEDNSHLRITINNYGNDVSGIQMGYYTDWGTFGNTGLGNMNGNNLFNGLTAVVPYSGGNLYIGLRCQVSVYEGDVKVVTKEYVTVTGVVGWKDDLDELLGYTDGTEIIGYADDLAGGVIGYDNGKILYYAPGEIIGYYTAKTGVENGQIIGYLDGEQIGTKDGALLGYEQGEQTGWENTDELLYYLDGEFLYYTEGDQIGFADSDEVSGLEQGEFLYYQEGKIIGWKNEIGIDQGTVYAPEVFDLMAGNIKAGEISIFDNGDGTLTLTYLFYNGADPKEIMAGFCNSADESPDVFEQDILKPKLNNNRTYTIQLDYKSGDTVYIEADCVF